MSDTIYIKKISESFITINSSSSVEQELSDYFTFDVEGAKFTPKFKAKLWDGKIRLYNQRTRRLYAGLYDSVLKFAASNSYQVQNINEILNKEEYSREHIDAWIKSLKLHSRGNPIEAHDYQIDAVVECINNFRRVILSPTSSGKSLIIYLVIRWLVMHKKKVLLIVPTVDLVQQMFSDFEEYSCANGWSVENNCQMLYSGKEKQLTHNVKISTWQSLNNFKDDSYFAQYDGVICDEAHLAKATSITGIMEKCINAKYRIGTTGTLDKSNTNKLTLTGVFGPVHRVTTTKEMIDAGKAAPLKIKCLLLKYKDEIRKVVSKYKYDKEYEFIIKNPDRNKFITNLALSLEGNTLILVELVENQAKPLYDMIKARAGNRNVYIGFGSASIEEIREQIKNDKDAIIVASYKKMSTGTNIPSIENIIFGSPSKSMIRILQSIGRGLRLANGKEFCTLYDLIDDISWKSKKNTCLNHGTERLKIYSEENHKFKIIDIDF